MATHSSILAWRIPWTESHVGYSPWGPKQSDTTERLKVCTHVHMGVRAHTHNPKSRIHNMTSASSSSFRDGIFIKITGQKMKCKE